MLSNHNCVLPTSTEVPPFDETENSGDTERKVEKQGEEAKKANIEEKSFQAHTPSYDEARTLFYGRKIQENTKIEMDRISPMKMENDQKTFFSTYNFPTHDNLTVVKTNYEVQLEEMNKLLQVSEKNHKRQQEEEEIRRTTKKIYEINKKLKVCKQVNIFNIQIITGRIKSVITFAQIKTPLTMKIISRIKIFLTEIWMKITLILQIMNKNREWTD